jgi:hypothetical protein
VLESAAPIVSQRDAKAGKVTRRIARVDGRIRAARRVKALVVAFTSALDGAASDATTAAKILKAAELTALSEHMRAAALRGDQGVDALGLVRLEGIARRAVADLGIEKREPARGDALERYLAAKQRETAA